jgi:hypothetical protein
MSSDPDSARAAGGTGGTVVVVVETEVEGVTAVVDEVPGAAVLAVVLDDCADPVFVVVDEGSAVVELTSAVVDVVLSTADDESSSPQAPALAARNTAANPAAFTRRPRRRRFTGWRGPRP